MLWPTHHYRSVEDAAQNRRRSHAPDRDFIPFGGPPRATRHSLTAAAQPSVPPTLRSDRLAEVSADPPLSRRAPANLRLSGSGLW